MKAMEEVPRWVSWAPTIAMLAGLGLAWLFYITKPSLPVALAAQHEPTYKFLLNKWYFDELYDFLFVRPAMRLGRFMWKTGDGHVIDGFGPDGAAELVTDVTSGVVRLQTGYLYHYAFAMMIGLAALISWFMFGGLR
jgi:NADH-quinone oxidoreductase subunit L